MLSRDGDDLRATFYCKDPDSQGVEMCDTFYRTDRDSWVVAEETAKGWSFRRVRVVSEPLSDYQRMAVATCGPSVEAGEGLRWLPRRLVSATTLPANDCFVLDGRAVIFNVHSGDHRSISEIQYSEDPSVVTFCRDSVEAAWARAVPHFDYRPR